MLEFYDSLGDPDHHQIQRKLLLLTSGASEHTLNSTAVIPYGLLNAVSIELYYYKYKQRKEEEENSLKALHFVWLVLYSEYSSAPKQMARHRMGKDCTVHVLAVTVELQRYSASQWMRTSNECARIYEGEMVFGIANKMKLELVTYYNIQTL